MFQAQTRGEIKVKIGVIKVIINIYLPIIKQLSGRSRGGVRGAWATPYFWTKLRPNGPKKFFLGHPPPPPPCSWLGWYRHHIIQCILHFVWFQIYWKKKTFNFSFSKSCKIISYLPFSDSLVSLKKIVIRGGCHIVGGSRTTHSVIKAFWVLALHQKLILSGKELVLQIHVSFSIPLQR